jgi:hypothetical protein
MAEDKLINQNMISEQIMIRFLLKILKLGLIILHIGYFIGMCWYIIADLSHEEEATL